MLSIERICFLCVSFVGLSACGTLTPIPVQGGGKRFAVEQALVAAATRSSFADLPIKDMAGKKISLALNVISDEGGGVLNGGRNQISTSIIGSATTAAQSFNGNVANFVGSGGTQRSEAIYAKDNIYAVSDRTFFTNLLVSYFNRNNIEIVGGEREREANLAVELQVDMLGIVRDRTDWLLVNSEDLVALVSLEFVVSPLHNSNAKRVVGRISYEAAYKENYVAWNGPIKKTLVVRKSETADIFNTAVMPFEEAVLLSKPSTQRNEPVRDTRHPPIIPSPTGSKAK